jgi:serine/threonine protein kinase
MAPEMVLEKSYDYRIDIWALGVLLFELVHGKAPFQA